LTRRKTVSAAFRRLFPTLPLLPYFILAGAPLAFLAADAALHPPWLECPLLPAGRIVRLFLNSVALSLAVGIVGTAWGALAALCLAGCRNGIRRLGVLLLPLPLLTPPYILAVTWWSLLDRGTLIGRLFLPVMQAGGTLSDALGAVLLLSFGWFPIPALLLLSAMRRLPGDVLDAARIQAGQGAVWIRGLIPLLAPSALAGGALLSCLTLTAYGVPALFQVRTLTLEMHAEFSSSGDPVRAAIPAVPLLLAAGAVLWVLHLLARGNGPPSTPPSGGWPEGLHQPPCIAIPVRAVGLITLALLCTPVLLMAAKAGSWRQVVRSGVDSWNEISVSLALGAGAAILCTICALPLARLLTRRPSPGTLVLGLLPLAIPAPLFSLGVLGIWSPLLAGTHLPLVVALAGRLMPFALLSQFVIFRTLDPLLFEMGELHPVPPTRRLLRVTLPLLLPGVAVGGAVTFALTLGDLGSSVLLDPPGAGTFPVKLFNLLHYGAGDQVAGMALCILPIVYLLWGLAVLLAKGWHR